MKNVYSCKQKGEVYVGCFGLFDSFSTSFIKDVARFKGAKVNQNFFFHLIIWIVLKIFNKNCRDAFCLNEDRENHKKRNHSDCCNSFLVLKNSHLVI